MRAVVLDGSLQADDAAAAAAGLVAGMLRAAGHDTGVLVPRELSIEWCSGCFGCWYKTPGVCVTDDDARHVVEAIATADLVALVTPVTYGGYSSVAKAALDRSIGLVSPLFTTIGDETHHLPRYERYPVWAIIGVQSGDDPAEAAVFRGLASRNALNFYAPAAVTQVLVAGDDPGPPAGRLRELEERLGRVVADAAAAAAAASGDVGSAASAHGAPGADVVAAASARGRGGDVSAPALPPPRDALLLVGSPRPGRSTSGSLATYLGARLLEAGLTVTTVGVRDALETSDGERRLQRALAVTDLVVVLAPLYVDALPAPVTRAFEILGRAVDGASGIGRPAPAPVRAAAPTEQRQPRLVAVINSGFPEAAQSDAALAICRMFALSAQMHWAGGLALGAGAALDGRPLAEVGDLAGDVRRALDLTASALAAGEAVPRAAVSLMAGPLVPAALYRESGDRTFRRLAERQGVVDRLGDRPYTRERSA